MKKNDSRWLGLKPYEESDSDLFFGRDIESEQFYRMVTRKTLTTIFAPSGTGKTSLLRAGVFPKLRKEGFFPIWLRLDHSVAGVDHSKWLRDHLEEAAKSQELEIGSIVSPQTNEIDETLWEYLHRVELWDQDNHLITPVIVLDQFEEIFSVGKNKPESEEFLQVLADIVEKRIPQELRNNLYQQNKRLTIPTEIQGFKIILSLREDFVAHLDDLRKTMPSIMHNRYSLHSLTGEQALQIVLNAGKSIVDPSVAHNIVRIVAKAGQEVDFKGDNLSSLSIEANLLSLVCYELDQQRIRDEAKLITAEGLENSSTNILRRFYDESFEGLVRSARVFVEDQLLTTTGFRKSQPKDDAFASGMSEAALKQLIDRHVLRQIDRKDMPRIELTHDLLTEVVKESRDLRHEIEEIEHHKRERKRHRKRIHVFTLATLILSLSLIFAMFSTHQAKEAESRSERMLNFMANDLYDRLLPIGRLDLLEEVAQEAYDHFNINNFRKKDPLDVVKQAQVLDKIANVLTRKGNVVEAMKTYKSAIKLMTDLIDKGEKTEFDGEWTKKLVKIKIDYASILKEWGIAEDAIDEAKDARSRLDKIDLTSDSKNVDSLLYRKIDLVLIQVFLQRGLYQQALNSIEKLFKSNSAASPQNDQEMAFRAEVYRSRAQANAGLGVFSKVFRDIRNSLKIFNVLSKDAPGNDEWAYRKALVLKELGMFHLAIRDYEGAKDKLEPALAIATKKTGYSLKRLQNKSIVHSQWSYLSACLVIELDRLWLEQFELASSDEKNSQDVTSLAEKYQKKAKLILDAHDKEFKSVPLEKLIDVDILILSSRLHAIQTENEVTRIEPKVDVARELQGGIEIFNQDVFKNIDNPMIILKQVDLLKLIAQFNEKTYNTLEPPNGFIEGIRILEKTIQQFPQHQLVRERLAQLYTLLAAAYKDRGKPRSEIEFRQKALDHFSEVASRNHLNLLRERAKAEATLQLADALANSKKTAKISDKASDLYYQAFQTWNNLKQDGLLRVSDRLNAAKSLYRRAILLQTERREEAMSMFKKASELGWKEATLSLLAFSTTVEKEEELKALAIKQKRKSVLLACIFEDELEGDVSLKIPRRVFSEVILTTPSILVIKEGINDPIKEENNRLWVDLMLKIDPKVQNEISGYSKYINTNSKPNAEISLAQATDNTLSSQTQSSYRLSQHQLVELQSPVPSKYPKRIPTVFGNDCWFRWNYKGTDDKLRAFQLQISSNKEFSGTLIVDQQINGTNFRYDFEDNKRNLNKLLYWRVRPVSQFRGNVKNSDESDWSLTHQVEVYESVWKRIIHTGTLRIGVTQYEGDFLRLDEESTDKLGGFDGEVIELIRKELSKHWLSSNIKISAPSIDTNVKLKLDPIVYGWDGMFEAVSRNDVDFSLSTITRTKEREKRYGIKFSEPYFETQLAIVYRKDELSIETIEDVQNVKLVANKGFRGAEIGELIVGDLLEAKSFANLELLVKHVLKTENTPAAITDCVFLNKRSSSKKGLGKGVGIYRLTHRAYKRLIDLELEKAPEIRNEIKIQKLREMQSDYGTAEWEQYAVATNSQDDGKLLEYLNKAILIIREDGSLLALSRDEGLLPPSESSRLFVSNQIAEETRRLATVIPLFPNIQSENEGKSLLVPSVMGDEIYFEWDPLVSPGKDQKYRIQVSELQDFSGKILLDEKTSEAKYTVKHSDFKGKLFWRAKMLDSLGQKDDFPQDGWSNPVGFEYYKDSMSRIRSTGILKVGMNISNGFSIYKDQDQELKGFDLEIMNYLIDFIKTSEKLSKLELLKVPMDFIDMFPMVKSHQIDVAISGITKTKKREQEYNIQFSTPYCKTRQAAIWIENSSIGGVRDLVGKPFIVFEKTRAVTIANLFAEDQITMTRDNPKPYLLEKLIAGDAVAAITDYPAAIKLVEEYTKLSPEIKFRVEPIHSSDLNGTKKIIQKQFSEDDFIDWYGIPLQKDQGGLIKLINEGINRLRNEDFKKLQEIFEKHQTYNKLKYPEPPFELQWKSDVSTQRK